MQRFCQTILACSLLLCAASCSTSPERNFGLAVLNTNHIVGFADEGMQRELDPPSVTAENGDINHPVPMKRRQVVDDKIIFVENVLEDLNDLKKNGDTREMLETSIKLNEYILSVYKNEYRELAALYDDNATPNEINSLTAQIHDKYYPGFDELYNKLIGIGKSYARKHDINVSWAD